MDCQTLKACEQLTKDISVASWTHEKLMDRENSCSALLKKKGITIYSPGRQYSLLNQIINLYRHLLDNTKQALQRKQGQETQKNKFIEALELIYDLIRLRRRFELLNENDLSALKKKSDPFHRGLVATVQRGKIVFPETIVQEMEPIEQELRDFQRIQQNADDIQQMQQNIVQYETLEVDHAKQTQQAMTELKREVSQAKQLGQKQRVSCQDKIKCLQSREQEMMRKRVNLLKDLKRCQINNDRYFEALRLLEKANERLDVYKDEKEQLQEEKVLLTEANKQYKDQATSMQQEIEKLKTENYYLQEVIIEVEKNATQQPKVVTGICCPGASKESPGTRKTIGRAEQQQISDKLREDKMILQNRLKEAQKIKSEWDSVLSDIKTPIQGNYQ